MPISLCSHLFAQLIKLYAWEIPFRRNITSIRDEELSVLKGSALLTAASSFTWICAPFLVRTLFLAPLYVIFFNVLQVALATFATYSFIHHNDPNPESRLTAEKVFVALSLFNILRFPLSMLPRLISSLVEVRKSVLARD